MLLQKLTKRLTIFILIFILCINNFAAVVSDNDGSAFVTKSEFDALKNSFASQIENYNNSIEQKIDGAIAAYLAGLRVSTRYVLKSILNDINSKGFNYNGAAGFPFTNGSLTITCTEQTPEVYANGTFTYQNLTEVSGNWSKSHHTGAGRANYRAKTGAGTAWRFVQLYGENCLENYMNLYEQLIFSITDSPALHDGSNYALAHTYNGSPLNRNTNLTTESYVAGSNGSWQKRSGTGSSATYTNTGLSSGNGYTTLSKSIINSINNATQGYAAPIDEISRTTYGYGYRSDATLENLLTKTNPMNSSTDTDNEKVTFNTPLFWSCINGSCPWGTGASGQQAPVTTGAYEHLYWNKQYVNTSRFALTDVNIYGATLSYGAPVKYYHGLPICKNENSLGSLTFSLKPMAVGSGTVANKVGLCFRTAPFANMSPASDTANNMKNIQYKKQTDDTYTYCNSAGGVDNLEPGTTYDFLIEDFPTDTVLWVKPYRVQNSSSTGTTVYAYLTTVGDIVLEEY